MPIDTGAIVRKSGRCLLALLLMLAGAVSLHAQGGTPTPPAPPTTPVPVLDEFTTEGREFWVVFQKNFRDYVVNEQTLAQQPAHPLQLELFITSSVNTKGYIEIKGTGFRRNFVVQAGRVMTVPIDTAAQVRGSETVQELGVHIVAEDPVAVYGLNRRYQTTDTYLAYPVNVLGNSYRVMGYQWLQDDLLSQVAIIATVNNTKVRITPSTATQKGRPAGQPFEVTLNRGQVYQVIPRFNPDTKSDLTGTLIEADHPIAVFSGHNCAYVPDKSTKACNLLVEQLPALQSWGRQFYVGTLAGRSSSVYRVLATENNTQVFEDNNLVATLQAGEFFENKNQTRHLMISSNNPVLVAQFSKGYDNGDDVGDPMMIIVSPTEQFLSAYRFATPVRGAWHHYINLVAPTQSLQDIRLDGKPIDLKLFSRLGLSRYSLAQVAVSYGTHVINSSEPFGLYSYGFGYDEAAYDAYGNGGGQSMDIVIELPDTTAPAFDATMSVIGRDILGIARDDRVNDRGMSEVVLLDYENLRVEIAPFEQGAPQVPVTMTLENAKADAYALFRLRDGAGNTSYATVCARYDEFGDTMNLQILREGESCDFSGTLNLGGYLGYSIIDSKVEIPAHSDPLGNPVVLKGSGGEPVWSVGFYAERPYGGSLFLTGRAGFTFLNSTAFGYWPDSVRRNANDGQLITEEFSLERSSLLLTLSPGIQWYFVDRRAYLFGLVNVLLPLNTTETLWREVLSPANFVYVGNEGLIRPYKGEGPSGVSIGFVPEAGVGFSLDLRMGWRVFGEIGLGYGVTSVSPERDWMIQYVSGRGGVKARF